MESQVASDGSWDQAFQKLIEDENGNWAGREIPPNAVFPDLVQFPIRATQCKIYHLTLENVVFQQPVDFTGSVFEGGLVLKNVIFEQSVKFDRCLFNGQLEANQLRCKGAASFHTTDFCGKTIFRAIFAGDANFNGSIFRESATFSGWTNVNLRIHGSVGTASSFGLAGVAIGSKLSLRQRIRSALGRFARWCNRFWRSLIAAVASWIRHLERELQILRRRFKSVDPNTEVFSVFENEGQMQGVVFLKPEQTVFSETNLSKVYFRGTNLRGVRFLGVNWWQPKLGRNGLHDEQFVRLNPDGPFRHRELPMLEETCRNARVALEENRNFAAATDFYVGEMEAARAQLSPLRRNVFSVPAIYCAASRYGSSVSVAMRTLGLIVLTHIGLTLLLQQPLSAGMNGSIDLEAAAYHSARVLMLQSSETSVLVRVGWQAWIDLLFRLVGAAQIAMVVLAFRARIKRH